MNRRSKIAKNVNPYKNQLGTKEPRILRHSANKNIFVEKGKELKLSRRDSQDHSSLDDPKYNAPIKKKNSARLSEEISTHRERQSIEDYSKVLKKLKKISVSKDRAVRNQVHQLDADHEFMKNQGIRGYSRKSQCRRQPSQSKMVD